MLGILLVLDEDYFLTKQKESDPSSLSRTESLEEKEKSYLLVSARLTVEEELKVFWSIKWQKT